MAKARFIISTIIIGSMGLFVKMTPYSSGFVAFFRGLFGMMTMLLIMKATGSKFDRAGIKKNLKKLIVLGMMLAANWIALYESYRYTTLAVATLCCYMCPVFIILLSPFIFKEKLTLRKLFCVALSLAGVALISGISSAGASGGQQKGVMLGLVAAVFFCMTVIFNKKIEGIDYYNVLLVEFAVTTIMMLPYVLLTENIRLITFTPKTAACLVIVGVVHSGIALYLYYSSSAKLKANEVAIYTYISPLVSVLLSAFVLHEKMTALQALGAGCILCGAVLSELGKKKN